MQLILGAYTWAAMAAALGGIAGYFDLVPGAHELMTRWSRATGLFKDPNVFGPFLIPALVYALSRLSGAPLRKSLLPLGVLGVVGFAILLSFSRGAWFNLAVAVGLFGALHVLTARSNWVRLRFIALAVGAVMAAASVVIVALQFDAVADLLSERAALTQSYDEGPEGRFGGQEKAVRLIVDNPLGIGAQQFVPRHHHEEPHNVYLAMFLNAGWLGGLVFLGLIGSTALLGLRHALARGAAQPLFLVVYACFVGNACEGLVIDLDHWRHVYLLMAMVWGMMASDGAQTPRWSGLEHSRGLTALLCARNLLQARKLGQRVGMIVDANVDQRPFLVAVDQQGRRLSPALVAAGCLGRLQSRDKSLRKRHLGARLVGCRHVVEHAGLGQDVAREREARHHQMPAPLETFLPRVGGEAALAVHHVHLADVLVVVGGDEQAHDVGGRGARRQQRQTSRPVELAALGLAGDGADAGPDEGHARAGGEGFARNGDADLAGALVVGDDREGHRAASPNRLRFGEACRPEG